MLSYTSKHTRPETAGTMRLKDLFKQSRQISMYAGYIMLSMQAIGGFAVPAWFMHTATSFLIRPIIQPFFRPKTQTESV